MAQQGFNVGQTSLFIWTNFQHAKARANKVGKMPTRFDISDPLFFRYIFPRGFKPALYNLSKSLKKKVHMSRRPQLRLLFFNKILFLNVTMVSFSFIDNNFSHQREKYRNSPEQEYFFN